MKSSFIPYEGYTVECSKCNADLENEEGGYCVYSDIDSAKDRLQMEGWELEGDQATCLTCIVDRMCNLIGISRCFKMSNQAGVFTIEEIDMDTRTLHVYQKYADGGSYHSYNLDVVKKMFGTGEITEFIEDKN